MPNVRILKTVAGLDFLWSPGAELDLTAAEADLWCDGEHAERIIEEPAEKPAKKSSKGK